MADLALAIVLFVLGGLVFFVWLMWPPSPRRRDG